MNGYSDALIWAIVAALAVGTYLIRVSFLALVPRERLTPFLLRTLRYTPMAVIPAMVAPLILWPEATGGDPDAVRIAAAVATGLVAWWRRNTLWGAVAGAAVLALGLAVTGQL